MPNRNCLPVGAAIGFVFSLFASTFDSSAYAASGCLSAPNRESGPGTHWNYRINQSTKERCWYLKKVGAKSRARPTSVAKATRSRVTREVAAATPSRAAPVEVAAPAENDKSIRSWFAETFNALSSSSAPTTQTREPAANEAPPPRKRRAATAEHTENKTARAQELPEAKEATEDKAVAARSDQQAEWQALYEEFLQWRVKQLMFSDPR
jgi:hypothetical protein